MKLYKYSLVIFLFMLHLGSAHAQSKGIADIEKALKENKVDRAEEILRIYVDRYITEKNADSLVEYIFYTGKVAAARSRPNIAEKKMLLLVEKIKNFSRNPSTLRQACLEAGEFYGSVGMNTAGYKIYKEAIKYTLLLPGKKGNQLALVENNLSTMAQRMGNINLAMRHTRNSSLYLLGEENPDYETLYISYNGLGSLMWYTSKVDSALHYYNKALETLDRTERTPKNSFFRPAIVLNNLSGLYQLQGKTTQSIRTLELCLNYLKKYLATDEPDLKKNSAITFQFEATDNLAGIYKEIGDLKKAHNLLDYSYQQKQKILTPDDPGIFISQILLGQLYFATREYDKSLQFLNTGLKKISVSDGDYLFWQADANSTLALLYEAKKNTTRAAYFYEKADSLYEESLQGEYDNIYLECLRNAALFYAQNNQPGVAAAKAIKGYNYVVKTQGSKTLVAFYQLINLAQVNYLSGQYASALSYSRQSLEVVDNIIRTSDNLLDSVRMELKKPLAVLQKSKAAYQLLKNKNFNTLTPILEELNKALQLIEHQKTVLDDSHDISLLMADNNELIEFIKKITLELYNTTGNPLYINHLLNLHESGIYNRIRSRLDKNDSLQYAYVPAKIRKTEIKLKLSMANALKGVGTHDEKMQRYFAAIDAWTGFQEKIRIDFPRYYKLRYASILTTNKIEESIPANTSLIRYLFVQDELYALVADDKQKQLFSLGNIDLNPSIAYLAHYASQETKSMEILHTLYQQLWKPFAKNIKHKKIIIIPDGILYNLNFELLTSEKLNYFRELSKKSLLSQYTISYNYSLNLLNAKNNTTTFKNNFVAFAPGFSDKIKIDYQDVVKDTMLFDKGYLSLLPQPFSIGLATRIGDMLGGNYFIHEKSTKESFRENAGSNRIIHIGTHAESNNEHPEFSKLIFAKNMSKGREDNALFVDEIYNFNLQSELAVLTACESGKPGYQDGEGMISLAHAFNYAGSESILTGLWKIDEQASAQLLDLFYANILDGFDKDEALRAAKLSYLQKSEGRMLSPQYWAGLVIVGDTSPVDIQKNHTVKTVLILGFIMAITLLSGWFLWNKRKKDERFKGSLKTV